MATSPQAHPREVPPAYLDPTCETQIYSLVPDPSPSELARETYSSHLMGLTLVPQAAPDTAALPTCASSQLQDRD